MLFLIYLLLLLFIIIIIILLLLLLLLLLFLYIIIIIIIFISITIICIIISSGIIICNRQPDREGVGWGGMGWGAQEPNEPSMETRASVWSKVWLTTAPGNIAIKTTVLCLVTLSLQLLF